MCTSVTRPSDLIDWNQSLSKIVLNALLSARLLASVKETNLKLLEANLQVQNMLVE